MRSIASRQFYEKVPKSRIISKKHYARTAIFVTVGNNYPVSIEIQGGIYDY